MEDYPRTLQALESLFASEEACRDYLARLRWPHGFVCPTCEGTQAWCTGRGLWMCGSCRHQTSVTVLVQTGKRIGDNGIWRIAKLNGILYLPDVDSKTTSFSSAFAGIFASN